MNGDVVHLGCDSPGLHLVVHLSAVRRSDGIQVVPVPRSFWCLRRKLNADALKQAIVLARQFLAALDEPIEFAHLAAPQRGLHVGHPIVHADLCDLVAPPTALGLRPHAVRPEPTQRFGQVGVVGGHDATLAGGHRLDRELFKEVSV